MRRGYLITMFSLALCVTAATVRAQQPYPNASASNYGFAPRPDNWQPNAAPNWYQQPLANAPQQPIGSGIPSNIGPGYPPAGPAGLAPSNAAPYNTGTLFSNTQYPSTQYSPPQYSAGSPYNPPAYSQPASPPNTAYAGIPSGYVGHPAFGSASGQLFEASSREAASLGGPSYQGPSYQGPSNQGPSNQGPSYQSPSHQAPTYGAPQYSAPTYGGVMQGGVTQGSPAAQFWSDGAADGSCGYGPDATAAYGTPAAGWFGGVYALLMTRDQENNVWLSYNTNDISQRLLTTHDADAFYNGGLETRFGRYFGCGSTAFEVVYWGLYPGTQEANVYATDLPAGQFLDTILHFDGIGYDPGPGYGPLVSDAFFQADRHRLQRDYNLQNIALNLLETNFVQPCGCANINLTWGAGLRYVKFDENFLYSADPSDTTFNGAPQEVNYGINAKNNLIGFQVGGRANICFKPGFTSFFGTQVGIFANRSSQHSRIYGSNGTAEVADLVSPYYGTPLDVKSNKTHAAFLAELRTGLNYQFTPCWSGTIGYRALGLTGVALATNQIPVDFIGAVDSLRTVNTNGCLIAHGAFVGLNFCY